MKYFLEIRLPSGKWARMQWCGDTFVTEAAARRACGQFLAMKLDVRVAEDPGPDGQGTRPAGDGDARREG